MSKRALLIGALLLFVSARAWAQDTAGLVQNGDFEQVWTDTPPTGWAVWGVEKNTPSEFARDTTQFHSGSASMRLHHRAGIMTSAVVDWNRNRVEVQPGKSYEFSFWAKADRAGVGQVTIVGFSSLKPQVGVPQVAIPYVSFTTEWKRYSLKLTEGADFSLEQARFLGLSISPTPFLEKATERTLWIDDVAIRESWSGAPASSKIVLDPLFGDGMVLQRGIPMPLWGTALPGQKISVFLNGKETTVTADASGKWMLRLPAMAAGGPYDVEFDRGQPGTFALHDVLIGDVWVASGQSNMDFRLGFASTAQQAMANSNDSQLRMFTVKKNSADQPQRAASGGWQPATMPAVSGFSAVAFFFGRELRRELNVPIGILHASYGGSSAQTWVGSEALAQNHKLQLVLDNWKKQQDALPAAQAKYETELMAWQTEADKAKAEGRLVSPIKPSDPATLLPYQRPSGFYNGMIAPLIPYGIKGAIWYQGEANAGNPTLYQSLFPTLINNWRHEWEQGDFPFFFVQLPNISPLQKEPVETVSWADMREVQEAALAVPNTGMATTIDLGDAATIHPLNKEDVGKRLAAVALAQVYAKPRETSGPTLDGWAIAGNQIRLRFQHARGLKARGETLKGFAIAGADKKWVWADAHIDGETVLVSSPQIAAPAHVRYAWASNPIGNLANSADLPASSFRTDRN